MVTFFTAVPVHKASDSFKDFMSQQSNFVFAKHEDLKSFHFIF